MNAIDNQREMAEQVLSGDMPLATFVSRIGDKGQALRECGLAVLESRRQKSSSDSCEVCGTTFAGCRREYHWQVSYAPNLGRNAFVVTLTVAAALLARQLGWHAGGAFGQIELRPVVW